LGTPVTLQQNSEYRLWFESSGSWSIFVPYTFSRTGWPETTWGGVNSYYIGRKDGSAWGTILYRGDGPENIRNQADLTFDFQQ